MNLYLVERTDKIGYDEYDSSVVIAKDEQEAISLSSVSGYSDLKVTLIEIDKAQSILSSYNAG